MNILSTVGFSIAGFVVVLFMIFMVGFKTKVADEKHEYDTGPIEFVHWKDEIPTLIKMHYEAIYETSGMPVIKTVLMKGDAKYKISNLWMPVKYNTWVDHQIGFLRELDFFWYGKIILKGLDFWIKGVGALLANGVIRMNETGNNVTEGQWISYWAENLLTGTCDLSHTQLKWETTDGNSMLITLPSYDVKTNETQQINVGFDADTQRIKSISAQRYRGHMERKRIPWTITVKKWEKHHGMWIPEYHVRWEDQKKPWCKFKATGVYINTNMEAVRDKISEIPLEKYKKDIMKRYKTNRVQTNKC